MHACAFIARFEITAFWSISHVYRHMYPISILRTARLIPLQQFILRSQFLFYQKLFHSVRAIKAPTGYLSRWMSNSSTITRLTCQSNIYCLEPVAFKLSRLIIFRLAYQFFAASLWKKKFPDVPLYKIVGTRKTNLSINLLDLRFTIFFFNPASLLPPRLRRQREMNFFFVRDAGSWVINQLSYRTNRTSMSVTPEDVVTPGTATHCRRRRRWSGATACCRDPRLNWAACTTGECGERRV